MNCEKIRSLIYDCVEGSVPEEQKKQIHQHLEKCAACYSEYKQIEELMGIIKGLHEVHPPDHFVESVLQKVIEKKYQKTGPVILLGRIAVAQIIVLVMIVLFKQPQQPPISPLNEGNRTSLKETVQKEQVSKPEEIRVHPEFSKKQMSGQDNLNFLTIRKEQEPEIVLQLASRPVIMKETEEKAAGIIFSAPASEMRKQREKEVSMDKIQNSKPEESRVPVPSESIPQSTEITGHILNANGRILSEKTMEDTKISRVVFAEIPAHSYKNFIDDLNEKFQVKNYSEIRDISIPETSIRIRIEILK